ncbi:MAG: GNAT family N-acetyltransferase [Clostridia bacterium]|nr:GNAT family N-acetyltransferase [Clostridia bacterium]
MKIIEYENKYRDDLIFMVLQAKDALGKIPTLNEDLMDINANYFQKGDKFWLAVDESDRVVGSIGFSTLQDNKEVRLHRLYVKANLKRQGIGSQLLTYAEEYLRSKSKKSVSVHLGEFKYYFESYLFYQKHGYKEYQPRYMIKFL